MSSSPVWVHFPEPLLPGGVGLLLADSRIAGEAPRLARLFRSTWSKLPEDVRRLLSLLWAVRSIRSAHPRPLVRLARQVRTPGAPAGDGSAGWCYACTLSREGVFQFSAHRTRDMPDDLVEALAAHEVAHGWLYAAALYGSEAGERDCKDEDRTNAAAAGWGFDVDGLNAWDVERCIRAAALSAANARLRP